jgi:hypothetical protein
MPGTPTDRPYEIDNVPSSWIGPDWEDRLISVSSLVGGKTITEIRFERTGGHVCAGATATDDVAFVAK